MESTWMCFKSQVRRWTNRGEVTLTVSGEHFYEHGVARGAAGGDWIYHYFVVCLLYVFATHKKVRILILCHHLVLLPRDVCVFFRATKALKV